MNVMDVTKELVCSNFCFGKNWWKHDHYRHSMLYLYYGKFKFQNDKTTEIRR